MIQSMTGFSRKEFQINGNELVWEIRSINHRFLDASVHLPDSLNFLGDTFRTTIKEHLHRGKVNATLHFNPSSNDKNQLVINKNYVKQLLQARSAIAKLSSEPIQPLDPLLLLQWPGVLKNQQVEVNNFEKPLLQAFIQALKILAKTRAAEGKAIQTFLSQRLAQITKQLEKIKGKISPMLQQQREKLQFRLKEVQQSLDSARLEQEMVLFSQRIDIAEEINRLEFHLQQFQKLTTTGGVLGRRLDFLIQEIIRETNTLGSKSISAEIGQGVVEIKVLIEQMREQVQNVE